MAKVITCSAFDANSIMNAYKELTAWRRQFRYRCKRFVQLVAKEGAEIAQQVYGAGVVSVEAVPINSGYAIIANGEEVCFLEFGTGVYSDPVHELAGKVPFTVFPGSWSESAEGAGTWPKWLAAGNDAMNYPFNTVPRRGMLTAYKYITDNITDIANRVFK